MRRAKRLFQIMQLLRRDRACTIARLADEFKMAEGILYRDITYLMAAGVPIEGEPGGGYRLSQPTNLPPEIAYRVAQLRQTLHTVRQNRIQGAEPQDACEPVPEEQSPQDHLERKTADSD